MCRGVRCTVRRAVPVSRMLARARVARRRRRSFFVSFMALLLLAYLHHDLLAGVAHALALVGLRRAVSADHRRDLADLVAVDALHDDLGLARRLYRDALRHREVHRVREAEREVQALALDRRAVADADQFELALEAPGDARDHVREVRARRAGRG